MQNLARLRSTIQTGKLADDATVLKFLQDGSGVDIDLLARSQQRAIDLVNSIRSSGEPGLMETFLAEYGLSTDEGIALMCLAEALLRVPDAQTMDELIEDKIAPSDWNEHLGQSSSSLVNASTWALMLTGKVLQPGQGVVGALRGAIKRLGEPVIRRAVAGAMREMGRQFVLGENMDEALVRSKAQLKKGYTYSYDMLGEAALTADDATRNFVAYADAIAALAPHCTSADIRDNPGISIKLSAIHPRYEFRQHARVMAELVPSVLSLAKQAAQAGMGLNIDAEEADRLDLSLDVIQAVLSDPALVGWDGFGVVVQAYGKRAGAVIDWLNELAATLDRRIMVRLVKGAYWDTEIKAAQVAGIDGFPVFARKSATDVSYICCARKLLSMNTRIHPQFATHNAHTMATVLEMAGTGGDFEFQRLHGMGEAVHSIVATSLNTRCRIYAPVGSHQDLLAYLVRRLLENGANSSFVNQIASNDVSAEQICADPFQDLAATGLHSEAVVPPTAMFGESRRNSRGWDIQDRLEMKSLKLDRQKFQKTTWCAGPLLASKPKGGAVVSVSNPASDADQVGEVRLASISDAKAAISGARPWKVSAQERADVLRDASDLFENHSGELFALLTREAGKTIEDGISELREAVDFMRFYASEAMRLPDMPPAGLITCISPWNFPLAIFTGQITAALAAGNAVLAKPAESTALIAHRAVQLLHQAGVPRTALQFLPGEGADVGQVLVSDGRANGVCFTGSTATAQSINRSMADNLAPWTPLIAETGGINAMIVDSTALPEQAVADVVNSAFKSAGQRCSALRVLYLQRDVAAKFLTMLYGAMDQLTIGDPWQINSDIGPIISDDAAGPIAEYIKQADKDGRLLKQVAAPADGSFVGPAAIAVGGLGAVEREVFGPVLHVAEFEAHELDQIIQDINNSGYGLTFGMHSRIDDRIGQVTSTICCGNMYINRNQIGAVVGCQPFGGEGMSGTGPKAGGPAYVQRLGAPDIQQGQGVSGKVIDISDVQREIDDSIPDGNQLASHLMPGPTGESNQLATYGRGVLLCLGPSAEDANLQAHIARSNGCSAVRVVPGAKGHGAVDGILDFGALETLTGFAAVVIWGSQADMKHARIALAKRTGAIIPLITERDFAARCVIERHISIDTTAAGGNASLLGAAS